MKQLRGTKKFKSQKDMFAALEIAPAKRGKERNAQIKEIKKVYSVSRKENGSYELTRITKQMRSEEKKRKKKASGQIVPIGDTEVDLKGKNKYKRTGIYEYFYSKTFSQKFSGVGIFIGQFADECFKDMVYYRKRYCFEDCSDITFACKDRIKKYGDSMISNAMKEITRSILKSLANSKDYDLQLEDCYVMSDDSTVWGNEAKEIGKLYSDCIKEFNVQNKDNPYSMHMNKSQLQEDVKKAYFHRSGQNEIYPKWHCHYILHKRPDGDPTPSSEENMKILNNFFLVFRETLKFKAKRMPAIAFGDSHGEELKVEERKLLIEYLDKNIQLDPDLPNLSTDNNDIKKEY